MKILSMSGSVLLEVAGDSLRGAYLRGVDLRCANLIGADLCGANLCGANLRDADLRCANLIGADLCGANLSNANLPLFCKWSVSLHQDKIRIGCKIKTIEEWDAWFASTEEYETKRGTEDFKRIQANYLAAKAYKQHMEKEGT